MTSRLMGKVVALLSLAALTACSSGGVMRLDGAADTVVIVNTPQNAGMDALGEGILTRLSGGCLGFPDGAVVIFPYGTRALAREPGGVVTAQGVEIEVGETFQSGGGWVAPAPEIAEALGDCYTEGATVMVSNGEVRKLP